MIVNPVELYETMFKDVPNEIVASMGFETMLSSGLLSEELIETIEAELMPVFIKADELEVDLDWETVL